MQNQSHVFLSNFPEYLICTSKANCIWIQTKHMQVSSTFRPNKLLNDFAHPGFRVIHPRLAPGLSGYHAKLHTFLKAREIKMQSECLYELSFQMEVRGRWGYWWQPNNAVNCWTCTIPLSTCTCALCGEYQGLQLDRLQWIKNALFHWISWISQNQRVFLGIILSDTMKALAITQEHTLHVYGGAEEFSSYSRNTKAVAATQFEMYNIISRIFKISIY